MTVGVLFSMPLYATVSVVWGCSPLLVIWSVLPPEITMRGFFSAGVPPASHAEHDLAAHDFESIAEFVSGNGIDLAVIVNLAAAKTITSVGLRPVTMEIELLLLVMLPTMPLSPYP